MATFFQKFCTFVWLRNAAQVVSRSFQHLDRMAVEQVRIFFLNYLSASLYTPTSPASIDTCWSQSWALTLILVVIPMMMFSWSIISSSNLCWVSARYFLDSESIRSSWNRSPSLSSLPHEHGFHRFLLVFFPRGFAFFKILSAHAAQSQSSPTATSTN